MKNLMWLLSVVLLFSISNVSAFSMTTTTEGTVGQTKIQTTSNANVEERKEKIKKENEEMKKEMTSSHEEMKKTIKTPLRDLQKEFSKKLHDLKTEFKDSIKNTEWLKEFKAKRSELFNEYKEKLHTLSDSDKKTIKAKFEKRRKEMEWKGKEMRESIKTRMKKISERVKQNRTKFREKRMELKVKFKAWLLKNKRVASRIAKISDDKLQKLLPAIDRLIEKVENNTKLTDEQINKKIATYSALKDILLERLNNTTTELENTVESLVK